MHTFTINFCVDDAPKSATILKTREFTLAPFIDVLTFFNTAASAGIDGVFIKRSFYVEPNESFYLNYSDIVLNYECDCGRGCQTPHIVISEREQQCELLLMHNDMLPVMSLWTSRYAIRTRRDLCKISIKSVILRPDFARSFNCKKITMGRFVVHRGIAHAFEEEDVVGL